MLDVLKDEAAGGDAQQGGGPQRGQLHGRILYGDELHEECGVFGVYGHKDAAKLTYYGLHALQHRGQESAGIVTFDKDKDRLLSHRGMGLVSEVFGHGELARLSGDVAIGHVRYTTAGESRVENAQPLLFNYVYGQLALAHNGNLANAGAVRRQLERQGSIFQTDSDTEVIAHLIARSGYEQIEEAMRQSLSMIKGAYALLALLGKKMVIVLDPNGIRPLSLAKLGEGWVCASETCAFDVVGAEYVREVEPGEMITIVDGQLHSERIAGPTMRAVCTFEYIYFARPDSNIGGINVHLARRRLGRQLAVEAPVAADLVTGVPDSSLSAAIGYAEGLQLPYELALVKNRYVGRTFIQPEQNLREMGVQMKLNPLRQVVEGKKVVLVDDSIVRGTTMNRIVNLLKKAGATEVHVRITSPPIRFPCFYGIDTSSREELVASTLSVEEIRKSIGADSLSFLSVAGMIDAIGRPEGDPHRGHCLACFNGSYPTEIYEESCHAKHGQGVNA